MNNFNDDQYPSKHKNPQLYGIMKDQLLSNHSLPQQRNYDNTLIFFTFIFLIIALVSAVVILERHEKTDLKDAQHVLNNVKSNLQSKLIDTIKEISKTTACGDGFEKVPLLQWGGISQQCICKNDMKVYNECPTDPAKTCKMASQTVGQELLVWRTDSIICIKPANKFKLVSETQCPAGFKTQPCFPSICSEDPCPKSKITPTNLLTTLQRFLKIKHSQNIGTQFSQQEIQTNLVEEVQENIANHDAYSIPNAVNIVNTDTQKITYDTDATKQPYIKVVVSTTATLCWNSNLRPTPQSGKYLPLEEPPASGCGQFGDMGPYVELVDKMKTKSFYETNFIQDSIETQPFARDPFFVDDNNESFLLNLRRIKVGTAQECVDIDMKQIDFAANGVKNFKDHLHLIMYIAAIASAVILFIFILFKSFHIGNYIIKGTDVSWYFHTLGFLAGAAAIALGVYYFHFLLDSDTGLKASQSSLNIYIDQNCFEDQSIKTALNHAKQFIALSFQQFHTPILLITIGGATYTFLMIVGSIMKCVSTK